ncbi:MAG: HD domain-containing protein [Candidatus Pacebacteria bacterium]|nr:HD domain-containing protein [Candidatus Paceibacterota bacterium]
MKSLYVQDISNNSLIEEVFALDSGELLPFRNKPGRFLKLVMSDKTGTISAILWDDAEDVYNQIVESDFIKIAGRANTYKDTLTITAEHIKSVDIKDVDISDFLPVTSKNIDEMLEIIRATINNVDNSHLRKLLNNFWTDDKFRTAFAKAPAARGNHHAYIGGLLEHTTNMLNLVPALCANYPVDKDLLCAGTLLHDIGKIKEYQCITSIDTTDEGRLLGHIVIGIQMIEEKILEIDDFPKELRLKLLHMITSHHGHYEWQSPKKPKFLEACLLHHIDLVDARVCGYLNTEESTDDWVYSKSLDQWVHKT